MSPLSTLVLLVFLFGVAAIVVVWSLLTLGTGPRTTALVRIKKAEPKPKVARPNRFMKQRLETLTERVEPARSELPAEHVSRNQVRILKTAEPEPTPLESQPAPSRPTTYQQLVNRQRVPPKTSPNVTPKVSNNDVRGASTRRLISHTGQPPSQQTQSAFSAPLRPDLEDTSTQPTLFQEASTRPKTFQDIPPRTPQPSIARQASEEAFHASQAANKEPTPPSKSQPQKARDDAFEKFLRSKNNDDLSL